MPVTDANGREWIVPPITWGDLRKINATLRQAASELPLPKDPQGQPIWDAHHPSVHQWLLTWPPATILFAGVLLADQAKGLDETQFAACWKGDAIDQLRQAIWEELLIYFPQSAREPAQELAKALTAQRALTAQTVDRTISWMQTNGTLVVDAEIAKLQAKLKKLTSQGVTTPTSTSIPTTDVPTPPTTASATPPSSDSIPATGPTANSSRRTSRSRTPRGTKPASSSHASDPAG